MLKILWILEINAFSLRKMLFSLVLSNAEFFMFENANCTALLRKRGYTCQGGIAGADPGFLKRGFKCRKGGFVCRISHKIF